ncbi:TPA: hypothetical protein ACRZZH_005146 [Vibrio harveyi]
MFKKILFLLLFLTLSLAPVAIFICHFGYVPTKTLSEWGIFGSFVSGIYGTLAFFAVSYSLLLTKNQFTKQNEDTLFYKAIDSLDKHVQVVESEDNSLMNLSKLMQEQSIAQCGTLTRKTICSNFELINDSYIKRIFRDNIDSCDSLEDIKTTLDEILETYSSEANYSDKWERLKYDLGPEGGEPENTARELTSIGSILFYKVSFESRAYIFETALTEAERSYGTFIDRYKKTLHFSLDFAKNSINKRMYKNYIVAKLTKHEVVLLYYIAMIGKDKDFINLLDYFEIFNLLDSEECLELIIDNPSYEKVNEDVKVILQRSKNDKMYLKLIKKINAVIRRFVKK